MNTTSPLSVAFVDGNGVSSTEDMEPHTATSRGCEAGEVRARGQSRRFRKRGIKPGAKIEGRCERSPRNSERRDPGPVTVTVRS